MEGGRTAPAAQLYKFKSHLLFPVHCLYIQNAKQYITAKHVGLKKKKKEKAHLGKNGIMYICDVFISDISC